MVLRLVRQPLAGVKWPFSYYKLPLAAIFGFTKDCFHHPNELMLSQKRTVFFWLFSFLLPSCCLFAQAGSLQVDPNYEAVTLVNDVFAGGRCETIFNIQAIGEAAGIGFFSGGSNIVGFDRGILLSTGKVTDAIGPNNSRQTGDEPLEGLTGDQDLQLIAEDQIYDRVGLEFDFIPLNSEVSFRYVFASEEYCEFVGSEYNDVFGFFVSGPGINGIFSSNAINAAIVPGTNDAVSINTVNHTSNSDFYIPNERSEDQTLCNLPQEVNPLLGFIEYDGLTVVLTAQLRLIPCETYHIRLVIADVGDPSYDSAVLLEAGSFDLGGSVSLQSNAADTTNTLYEGCDSGGFRIVRGSDSDPNTAQTIAYRFGASSTATEGVDFINPGGVATIPAGEFFVDVNLTTIADGITEGDETIWVILDIPCACYTDSILVTLAEPAPLAVLLAEAYYCPDQMATLNPLVEGGSPPYTYSWSTGDTLAMPSLSPPLPPSIQVTVADACGQSTTWQIPTFSSDPPAAWLPLQNINACWGDSRLMQIELLGQPPFLVTYQRGANTPETISFAEAGRQNWPINLGGNYALLNVQDQACNGPVSGQVNANFYRPVINPSVTNPRCANNPDGRIEVAHLASIPPYTYEWTGTNASGLLAENLAAGTYSIRITDGLGCSDERSFQLRSPSPLQGVAISCNQVRRPPLRLSADGGQAPYTYSINGRDYWPDSAFQQLIPGEYYNLHIRDQNGCEFIQYDFFYPLATPRNTQLPTFIGQDLGGRTQVLPDYQVPYDQIQSLQWYPSEYFDCSNCREPFLSAPFSQPISLVVTDIYNCRDSLATWVGVDSRIPLFVPSAFSPNGDGTNDVVAIFANTLQVERVLQFRIFNRWGALLYKDENFLPNSARRGWDGNIGAQKAPPGGYAWVVELLLTNGEVTQRSGSVLLLR